MTKTERDALVLRIRSEAASSSRPGQMDRLLGISNEIEAMPVSDAEPVAWRYWKGKFNCYDFAEQIEAIRVEDRSTAEPLCLAAPPALPDGCSWTSGNEPCPTCPRRITALHMCKLLQDEAAHKVPR